MRNSDKINNRLITKVGSEIQSITTYFEQLREKFHVGKFTYVLTGETEKAFRQEYKLNYLTSLRNVLTQKYQELGAKEHGEYILAMMKYFSNEHETLVEALMEANFASTTSNQMENVNRVQIGKAQAQLLQFIGQCSDIVHIIAG